MNFLGKKKIWLSMSWANFKGWRRGRGGMRTATSRGEKKTVNIFNIYFCLKRKWCNLRASV